MTDMPLAQALGGLIAIPHFFLYRLIWNAAKGKFEKTPSYVTGAPLLKDQGGPEALWVDYTTAVTNLARLRARDGASAWTLGWWVTKDSGYWFLDADNVLSEAGEVSEVARYLLNALPGAFTEWSSSSKGLHFVGRGLVPPHSSCPAVAKAAGLEFYTADRGIAFGLSDKATGSADVDHTAAIGVIAAHWFKPNELLTAAPAGVDPAYKGPFDDEELLRIAMNSGSVESKLSGKASFADLWNRNVTQLQKSYPTNEPGKEFGESEADQALAFLLAFWTGRDAARIERLMQRSALKREKWDVNQHATYLAGTIAKACAGCSKIYVREERVQAMPVATTEEARAISDGWQQRILQADELELRNVVVPGIAADRSIEMLDRERLASILKDRLGDFMIPASIGQCRKMLRSAKVVEDAGVESGDPLPFAAEHVYVEQGDVFFNIKTADMLSRTAFQARYNREMPPKQNGDREDAAKWCLERWGTPTVHDTMYVPQRGAVFTHGGRQYANLYSQSTVPDLTDYTPEGVEAIHLFAKHLELFCGCRPEVYHGLLAWMAHNVQHPGRKIRFAPLLKGIAGDAKSVIPQVLKAAMGARNVSEVGPKLVTNSGGFTDWAHGACVIALEEMLMMGKERYAIANAIKENITNDYVTINRKHRGQLPIINISNFIGSTNHNNAVPLEDGDRRWWVIFSAFGSMADIAKLHGVDDFPSHFGKVFKSTEAHPGQWRRWLLELQIPEWFNPDGHAPVTEEKGYMLQSGEDETHSIARQVIEAGAVGVTAEALSSACLTNAMRAVCIMENAELPKGSKVNAMLNDLKYKSLGVIKIAGKLHRVWVRDGVSRDRARALIESTYQVSIPVAGA